MLIRLRKPSLQDQRNNCMVEFPPTMCDNIWWWSDPKNLHIFICKAIRQLGDCNEQAGAVGLGKVSPHLVGMRGGMQGIPMA